MEPLSENRIVLITRQTRLDELISRFNTFEQAKFYVEHLGADFSDYQIEDDTYKTALRQAEDSLRSLGRVQVLKRKFLPNFIFGKEDTIVVLGQDGLVANTLKYLNGQPVIAINPDPDRWDGVLLPFTIEDIQKVVPEVFSHGRDFKEITMAKAELNNGQFLYGVNDLFIGPKSHISARYLLEIGNRQEQQSSSGIIVSTGLGSTGWLKSILAGAKGIAGYRTKKPTPIDNKYRISWGSDYLYYTVREPFPSKTSEATLVFGKTTNRNPMNIVSQMPENGVIFSDGIEADFLEFHSGAHAIIKIAEKKGLLVV
jgi:NAD kinase